jgi:hypothetical protein
MPSSEMLRRVALVRTDVSKERQFLRKPHGVTSQKTAFFTEICSNMTYILKNKFPLFLQSTVVTIYTSYFVYVIFKICASSSLLPCIAIKNNLCIEADVCFLSYTNWIFVYYLKANYFPLLIALLHFKWMQCVLPKRRTVCVIFIVLSSSNSTKTFLVFRRGYKRSLISLLHASSQCPKANSEPDDRQIRLHRRLCYQK